jgi:3-hydroxyacyl-CoA dehydrogenase
MERIAAIIGAGLIGRAWAMVFARAGWRVQLYDSVPTQLDMAREHILTGLAEQEVAGLIDDGERAAVRVFMHERIEDAVAGATWVQENLPENVEIKRDMFQTLDTHAPEDAVLASSTSAIPASQFTETLAGRARCLVAHPVNPPHLVPVVELCGAEWTSYTTIERARTVMAEVGQVPVVVRRELDGFILNRLQGALLSEAMRLVGEGYVSPEDLDKTVAYGLGLRWSFMGPFATIELNAPGGVADYCARYGGFYRKLAAEPPTEQVWDDEHVARVVAALGEPLTPAGRERKMTMRDRRLLALAKHKRDQSGTN